MKERFWETYFWLTTAYLFLAIIVWLGFKITYNPSSIAIPDSIWWLNKNIFFNFVTTDYVLCDSVSTQGEIHSSDCWERDYSWNPYSRKYDIFRWAFIENYYPFFFFIGSSIIRFVAIGKHFWQR
tara:strand:- start:36 stop:410 length:375 start_codon:yes stop_codon:yes gene_type:complete